MLTRIVEFFKRRSLYNRTRNDLLKLSCYELKDIGINKSMINQIAYEAAYGHKD